MFNAGDRVKVVEGIGGRIVEPYSEGARALFDVGQAEAVRVYWVLIDGGQICRFVEDALEVA